MDGAGADGGSSGSSVSVLLVVISILVGAAVAWYFLLRPSKPDVLYARPQPALTVAATHGGAVGSAKKKADADEDTSLPLVKIFFGSQTGTAENYAKQLRTESRKKGFRAVLVDLAAFKGGADKGLGGGGAPSLGVFLLSTYGEGDPTDNAVDFTKWLKDEGNVASAPAAGLQYTVFGLGNRQYQHYNAIGKLADARLAALGGTRVHALGLGDDDADLEADFDAWRDGLWAALHRAAEAGAGAAAGAAGAVGSGSSTAADEARRRSSAASEDAAADEELDDLPPFPWRAVPLPGPPPGAPHGDGATEPAHTLAHPHLRQSAGAPASSSAAAAAAASLRALRDAGALADLSSRHFFAAVPVPVASNAELRPQSGTGASTRHVELDLTGSGLSYMTADNLYVLPENDPADVAAAARALGLDLDTWFAIEPAVPEEGEEGGGAGASPAPTPALQPLFPSPLSVRTLLGRYLDLAGEPKRELLGYLAHYAAAPAERAALAALAARGARGREAHRAWARAPQRSVVEALASFPSLRGRVPLSALLHVAPRLQPRAYTVASSALVQPSRVAIVASVVDAPKPPLHPPPPTGDGSSGEERRLRGVCTNYLLRCPSASLSLVGIDAAPVPPRVWVSIKPSSFRLPRDHRTPIILIGPGTGIAPMRAFLQERSHLRRVLGAAAVGPVHLFFGCRRRDADYIYRDELEGHSRDGTLTGLHVAFSREELAPGVAEGLASPVPGPRRYVQHLLAERGAQVAELVLRSRAAVYVCGATRMGHDVQAALQALLVAHSAVVAAGAGAPLAAEGEETTGGASTAGSSATRRSGLPVLDAAAAAEYLSQMKADGRYVQELWST